MKAKLWLVPALLLVSAFAQAQETLKVGFIRVMDHAQVMVAKEAGLYEKHGLNVELVEFSSGTDLFKAIVGGQLDTGVLGIHQCCVLGLARRGSEGREKVTDLFLPSAVQRMFAKTDSFLIS